MQILKKSILFLFAAIILFLSCSKQEDLTSGNGNTGDGQQDDLRLTLDLSAVITPESEKETLKKVFPNKVAAVVLIRSNENDLLYFPVSMARSNENPQSVQLSDREFSFDKIKANPKRQWQLRLIIGGQWNEESKHILFEAPSTFIPSEKKTEMESDQPYASKWTDIPTDEKGQFTTAEEGHTALSLQMETLAVTLVHHIVSCKAQGDIEIDKLKLNAGPLAFSGYFDLSDPEQLKTDKPLAWNTSTENDSALEINFEVPLRIKAGEQEPTDDFLYLWAMPAKSEEERIRILASGNMVDKEGFTDLVLFDSEFKTPANHLFPLDSKIQIMNTPISGPITLTTADDRKTIVANGKDKITFIVKQAGTDVTAQCRFYKIGPLWGEELDGAGFTTTRPGEYNIYAEKGNEKSNVFTITATLEEEIAPDGSILNGTLFCPNVTASSGWYDVNKVGNGNSPQDGLLCWAAAASNMLQWWLDDFKKKGHYLPESVPYGPGKLYRLAIFDTFYNSWENRMHSTKPGIRWFMEGGGMIFGASNGANPNKGGVVHNGGYFRNVLSKEMENRYLGSEYVKEYGAYYSWGNPYDNPELENLPTRHHRFSHILINLLKKGPSALSIDSHELTTWGCEVRNGLITKVYITNSDDGGNPHLASYQVIVGKDGWIHLKDYPGKTNRPTEVIKLTGFMGYPF